MYQYIYLVDRNPQFTPQEFVDRWRRHAVMAATERTFWDPIHYYVQNDVVREGFPAHTTQTSEFDAVAEFVYTSLEAKTAASEALITDASEIFGPRGMRRFGGTQTVVSGNPAGAYRIVLLVAQLSNGVSDQLVSTVKSDFAGLDCRGLACSVSTQPDFDFEALVTVWVDDLDSVARVLSSAAFGAGVKGLGAAGGGSAPATLVAREVPLYGARVESGAV